MNRTGHNIIPSPPKQWSGGSVHEIHQMHDQKYLDINNDVSLALLRITSTPISTEFPSPPTVWFNRSKRGPLPQMDRKCTNINNDDAHYETLEICQDKYVKINDTHQDSVSFSIGSTVAVQYNNWGPYMYGSLKRLTVVTTEGILHHHSEK